MNRIIAILSLCIISSSVTLAVEPDMIVTQSGESFNAYNLEITSKAVYYTTTEDSEGDVKKITKDQILIIKKSDGTKIDPNATESNLSLTGNSKDDVTNTSAHVPVIYTALEDSFIEEDVDWKKELKKYLFFNYYKKQGGKIDVSHEKFILVGNGDSQVLNMRVISDSEKTLAVARPRKIEKVNKKGKVKVKEGKYEKTIITIPDYVMIGNDKYTVTEIDPAAFISHTHIAEVNWPNTLKNIGAAAFWGCSFRRIVLPESLETIGMGAYYAAGDKTFEQLYVPKTVKEIGAYAFHWLGPNTSYRGFYQGTLTSIPDFVSTGNCKDFGIDEEAIESYERRYKK